MAIKWTLRSLTQALKTSGLSLTGQLAQGRNYLYHGSFSGKLSIPISFLQYRENDQKGHSKRAFSPSLVLNFGLRISSPESFPFFPAKVALGQPDKLEAEVIHHWLVQGHSALAGPGSYISTTPHPDEPACLSVVALLHISCLPCLVSKAVLQERGPGRCPLRALPVWHSHGCPRGLKKLGHCCLQVLFLSGQGLRPACPHLLALCSTEPERGPQNQPCPSPEILQDMYVSVFTGDFLNIATQAEKNI